MQAASQLTVEELSKTAMQGRPPNGMTLPDRAAWWPLRHLYAEAKAGRITNDAARAAKKGIVQQREQDNAFMAEAQKAMRYNADLWQRIEHAASVYARSSGRTLEGDALYKAIYGMEPGIGTAGNGVMK